MARVTSEAKKEQIKESLKATRAKRAEQSCKVFKFKLSKRAFNRKTREHLALVFLQAKWFVNFALAQKNLFEVDTRVISVPVKVGKQFEERALTLLSSQMKQALLDRLQANVRSLATKKKQGEKIGKLRFRTIVRAIPLKQYGNTYSFPQHNRLKLVKHKKLIKIRGMDQLPKDAEFANAQLLQRHGDYFLHVTTYVPKESPVHNAKTLIVFDVGLKKQFTFSNGLELDYRIPITQNLKDRHRDLSRTQKHSRNRYKKRIRLEKGYVHTTNRKQDTSNKITGFLIRNFQYIGFQDENLRGWQRLWGSKMMDTALGKVLSVLKERTGTSVVIDRFYASTQSCSNPDCSHRQKMPLSLRTYHCPRCGLVLNRDLNAALNLLQKSCEELGILFNRSMYDDLLRNLNLMVGWESTEAGQPTPVERRTSTKTNATRLNINQMVFHQRHQMLNYFKSSDVPFVTASSLDESGSPVLSSVGSTP
jgi:putative transposase